MNCMTFISGLFQSHLRRSTRDNCSSRSAFWSYLLHWKSFCRENHNGGCCKTFNSSCAWVGREMVIFLFLPNKHEREANRASFLSVILFKMLCFRISFVFFSFFFISSYSHTKYFNTEKYLFWINFRIYLDRKFCFYLITNFQNIYFALYRRMHNLLKFL